jgi:hypothetical protein
MFEKLVTQAQEKFKEAGPFPPDGHKATQDYIKNFVENLFNRNGELIPTLFVVKGKELLIVAIPRIDGHKDAVEAMARTLAIKTDANAVALAVEAWMAVYDCSKDGPVIQPPSERDDKKEILHILYSTPQEDTSIAADIYRGGDMARVGEWITTKQENREDSAIDVRFAGFFDKTEFDKFDKLNKGDE